MRDRDTELLWSHFWDVPATSVPVLYLHGLEVRPPGRWSAASSSLSLAPWPGASVKCWHKVISREAMGSAQNSAPFRARKMPKGQKVLFSLFPPLLSPIHPDSTWITASAPMASCANTGSQVFFSPQVFSVTHKGLSVGLLYSLSLVVNTTCCSCRVVSGTNELCSRPRIMNRGAQRLSPCV